MTDPGPVKSRRQIDFGGEERETGRLREKKRPQSYGTLRALCASLVMESARARWGAQTSKSGCRIANAPKAASQCSHASYRSQSERTAGVSCPIALNREMSNQLHSSAKARERTRIAPRKGEASKTMSVCGEIASPGVDLAEGSCDNAAATLFIVRLESFLKRCQVEAAPVPFILQRLTTDLVNVPSADSRQSCGFSDRCVSVDDEDVNLDPSESVFGNRPVVDTLSRLDRRDGIVATEGESQEVRSRRASCDCV